MVYLTTVFLMAWLGGDPYKFFLMALLGGDPNNGFSDGVTRW